MECPAQSLPVMTTRRVLHVFMICWNSPARHNKEQHLPIGANGARVPDVIEQEQTRMPPRSYTAIAAGMTPL